MKYALLIIFLTVLCETNSVAQDTAWTATDKKKLVDNYRRTQQEINAETASLNVVQWNFRETPTSWTIAEVLEHLNMWQLVTQEHARYMLYNGPQPNLAIKAPSDSANTSFIYEEKKHISPDFTIPTGAIPAQANLILFNSYCNRIIENIKSDSINFRLYFRTFTDGYMTNMNQAYIIQYGHVDRYHRQIRRIKSHAKFPA